MPIAGPSIQKNCLTSGVQCGQVSRSRRPRRRASAIAIASCVAPEARKPKLAMLATPGEIFGNQAAKARKAIMQILAAAGRGRRHAPGIVGVERALMQGEHGDEGDVGEHDARHLDRMGELLGLADEAGRGEFNEQRHVEIDEREEHDLRQDEQGEHLARETAGLLGSFALEHAGVGRQIGRVERALAKNLAELVGQLDRRHIGVVERAAAEQRRQRHVAEETRQPRGDRPAADGENVADHARHEAGL